MKLVRSVASLTNRPCRCRYEFLVLGRPSLWFAIDSIESAQRLAEVRSAGADRVVVVRAITEATDPQAAAAFARRLRSPR